MNREKLVNNGGMNMKQVCVYSGSNSGVRPAYKEAAAQLGVALAMKGIGLVYGGSQAGLMGEVAGHVLKMGGSVTGVVPEGLFPDKLIHQGLTRQILVRNMHERKNTMADLADGFIALPGGVGTFEELFEVLSWTQLGIHRKPVGILNTEGFFEPLKQLLHSAVREGFMNESNLALLLEASEPEELLSLMKDYEYPDLGWKWRS